MLTVITGSCGSGKSAKMTEFIRQALSENREVLVIVPEQFSFEAEKRLYGLLGAAAFNRMHTYSFATLSKLILQSTGSHPENYASEQQKILCMYRAVQNVQKRKELHIFEKRSAYPEFSENLLSVVTRFRKAGVTAERLLEALPLLSPPLSDKVHDLGFLLREYDAVLREYGLYDGLVDLTAAALLANMNDFFVGKTLFVDEFDSFTGDQYTMLDVMFSQAEESFLTIRTSDIHDFTNPVYSGNNHTYARITREKDAYGGIRNLHCPEYLRSGSPSLKAVSDLIFQRNQSVNAYQNDVHIFSCNTPIAEAEYTAASICEMLADTPELKCSDISVVVRSLDDYGPLLERTFSRYGLPFDITGQRSVLHTGLIRHFLAVMELLSEERMSTDALIRYLKVPFSGYSTVDVSMMEHYCFTWGIEEEDWEVPFYDEKMPETIQRAKQFGGKTLEETRSTLMKEISELRKKCQNQNVRTICRELYLHLHSKRTSREAYLLDADLLVQREFVTVWNMLTDMMDTVVSCIGEEVLPVSEIHSVFRMLLRSATFATAPQTLDSIRIVQASTALFNAPKKLFVMGVNDGQFPAEIVTDGLLTQQELDELNTKSLEITRLFDELFSNEKLTVTKILSAPTEALCLTVPSHDFSGNTVKPSEIIRQIPALFPEGSGVLLSEQEIPLQFYIRTMESAYFHYVRHMQEDTPETATLRELLLNNSAYGDRLKKLLQTDTVPDFQVSSAAMEKNIGEHLILSATKLESFYCCPFQFFCQYCLSLYKPEKVTLDVRNIGTFSHYCLEHILKRHALPEFLKMNAEALSEEIRALSAAFSKENFSRAMLRDSHFQMQYRMRGNALLEVLRHMQREMREGKFIPTAFEVQIGNEKGQIPPLLLRNGTVSCEGIIDRVDRCISGDKEFLRVVDYKTGEKTFSMINIAEGLDMQMLLYLFSLKNSPGYQKMLPGGVLYMPSGQMKSKEYQERSEKKKSDAEPADLHYRMRGLILEEAIPSMEPEIMKAIQPVELLVDENLYSVTQQQMQILQSHVEGKICQMADAVYEGSIQPAPFLAAGHNPCRYCNCQDFCGSAVPADTKLEVAKGTKEQALQLIFEKEGDDL